MQSKCLNLEVQGPFPACESRPSSSAPEKSRIEHTKTMTARFAYVGKFQDRMETIMNHSQPLFQAFTNGPLGTSDPHPPMLCHSCPMVSSMTILLFRPNLETIPPITTAIMISLSVTHSKIIRHNVPTMATKTTSVPCPTSALQM